LEDRRVPVDDQWLGHYVRRGDELGGLSLGLVHNGGHLAAGCAAGAQWEQSIPARNRICRLHGLLHFVGVSVEKYVMFARLQTAVLYPLTHKLSYLTFSLYLMLNFNVF